MLNFVLCDDNASVLSRLSKMLESIFIRHNIDASIILESSKANEVIEFVKKNKFNFAVKIYVSPSFFHKVHFK